MRRSILLIGVFVLAVAAGVVAAVAIKLRQKPSDHVDTELKGVSVVHPKPPAPPKKPKKTKKKRTLKYLPSDKVCWRFFGANPQRTLSRPELDIGRPAKHFWVRGLRT